MRIYGVFVLLTFLLVTSASAQDAMIVDFCGLPGTDFSIKDGNGERIEVGKDMILYPDTQIEVENLFCNKEKPDSQCSSLKGRCSVTLKVSGKEITVTNDGFNNTEKSTYKVKSSDQVPEETGVLRTAVVWLGGAIGEAADVISKALFKGPEKEPCCSKQNDALSIPLLDKEKDALSIPLLDKEKKVLLDAGEHGLSFGWQGGQQPYQVKLYVQKGKNKKLVQSKNNIQDKQDCQMLLKEVKLDSETFKEGEIYEVEVTDHTDTTSSGFFSVVSADKIPKPPIDSLSPPLKAVWLASQGPEWGLQAYQEVASGELKSAAWSVKWNFSKGNLPPKQ